MFKKIDIRIRSNIRELNHPIVILKRPLGVPQGWAHPLTDSILTVMVVA